MLTGIAHTGDKQRVKLIDHDVWPQSTEYV